MSPEAFIITWGNLGMELAVVRLIATIVMGIAARYVTLKMFPLEIPSKNWLKCQTLQKEEGCGCNSSPGIQNIPINPKVTSWKVFLIDVKQLSLFFGGWLLLAFLLEAIIVFYLPQEIIIDLFGEQNIFSVILAALIGVPLYFNNISAIPIVDGLMHVGMSKGAALAFLLAGPVTAIPATVAVFGLVKKKVFITFLVVGFILSVICGYLYEFILYLI